MDNVPDAWRPDRLAALVLTTVAALLTVYATSVPGWYLPWVAWLVFAWTFLGLIWLGTLARILFRASPLAKLRLEWPVWLLPPLIVLLAGGLVYMGAPLEARLALSRPAFDAFARTVSQGAPLPGDDEWIGLFPIEGATRFPGGALFTVDGAGFIGSTGFAWSPGGEPPQVGGEESYDHLRGPWYTWSKDI
ncbi:hypothetical protein [Nonomuraea insulae]|uniref:Uncharacterized protein n=1 Tax=Nonomuraea insulae TaxID=1616787 RepID=A0ABW1CA25_9ACTN